MQLENLANLSKYGCAVARPTVINSSEYSRIIRQLFLFINLFRVIARHAIRHLSILKAWYSDRSTVRNPQAKKEEDMAETHKTT